MGGESGKSVKLFKNLFLQMSIFSRIFSLLWGNQNFWDETTSIIFTNNVQTSELFIVKLLSDLQTELNFSSL